MYAQRLVAVLIVSGAVAFAATSAAQAQKGFHRGASRLALPSASSPGRQVRHRGFAIIDRTQLQDPTGARSLRHAGAGSDNRGPKMGKSGAQAGTDPNKFGEWIADVERPAQDRHFSGVVNRVSAGRRDAPAGGSSHGHPDFLWSPTSKPSADRSSGRYYVNGVRHRYSTGASQNSRPGTGVLKSTDGGRSWSKRKGFKSVDGLKMEKDVLE